MAAGLSMAIVMGILSDLAVTEENGPGYILSGSSSILNPDGGSYMSNQSGDVQWSDTSNEYSQFEVLAGSGGSNLSWQPLVNSWEEPTGLEVTSDISSGGGCGNTDIVVDGDGGNDYAYYSIIDPDAIADNGDEILALAVRISDEVSGAFSFSFLLDADNDCGADTNSVCGNSCFEYEIQISSQNAEVILINIDGCAGTTDCDKLHGTVDNGGSAIICSPCNTEALQVKAGSSACTSKSTTPVIWMAYIEFEKMDLVTPGSNFRLVPSTSTSSNSIIYKNTNVSDYGGIGDPEDTNTCDCATTCAGNSCSDCVKDCALSCAANGNIALPVEWLSFSGRETTEGIHLNWTTSQEVNNDQFEIQRQTIDGTFRLLGEIPGAGNSSMQQSYSYTDFQPAQGINVYRIKQVDIDGQAQYSSLLRVNFEASVFDYDVFAPAGSGELSLELKNSQKGHLSISIMNINGSLLYSQQIQVSGDNALINLPFSPPTSGIYVIRVEDQGHSSRMLTKKFRFIH